MVEKNEVIELINDLFSDEQESKKFICYLLLTKNDKDFDECRKSLNKLLEDINIILN